MRTNETKIPQTHTMCSVLFIAIHEQKKGVENLSHANEDFLQYLSKGLKR